MENYLLSSFTYVASSGYYIGDLGQEHFCGFMGSMTQRIYTTEASVRRGRDTPLGFERSQRSYNVPNSSTVSPQEYRARLARKWKTAPNSVSCKLGSCYTKTGRQGRTAYLRFAPVARRHPTRKWIKEGASNGNREPVPVGSTAVM